LRWPNPLCQSVIGDIISMLLKHVCCRLRTGRFCDFQLVETTCIISFPNHHHLRCIGIFDSTIGLSKNHITTPLVGYGTNQQQILCNFRNMLEHHWHVGSFGNVEKWCFLFLWQCGSIHQLTWSKIDYFLCGNLPKIWHLRSDMFWSIEIQIPIWIFLHVQCQ
jgi:hypothetical protein